MAKQCIDQLDFLFENAAKPFSDQLVQMLRVGKITRFRLNSFLPAVKFTESKDRMLLAIENSLEIPICRCLIPKFLWISSLLNFPIIHNITLFNPLTIELALNDNFARMP